MRFFSNEAKDNVDEPETDDRTAQGRPDPAAVPQQRAGSPWQHGPADVVEHPPAPQPTAFGASTVGGAVAASAAAGPHEEAGQRTDRTSDAASGVADDRAVAPGDGTDQDRTVAFGQTSDPDRTVALGEVADRGAGSEGVGAWPAGRSGSPLRTEDPVDIPLEDRSENRDAVQDRDTIQDRGTLEDRDAVRDRGTLEDRGTFEDPIVTEPAADHRPARTGEHAHTEESVIAEEPVIDDQPTKGDLAKDEPTAVIPQPTPAEKDQSSGPAAFFPTDDVPAMRERWRDVQLRFVDDPKAATTDAAVLVDEAVDKLTAALKQQRGALAKGSDDTETLRVELRSYRDILDRLLGI